MVSVMLNEVYCLEWKDNHNSSSVVAVFETKETAEVYKTAYDKHDLTVINKYKVLRCCP